MSTAPVASNETQSCPPRTNPSLPWIGWGVAALLLAVGTWSVFPGLVLIFNDDFGYVRSIVHTLERGRPWTDDWLEPWAASLSAISALVFRITGSFRGATQGVQVVAIVATWWLVTRWVRERGVGRISAGLGALLAITFPTVLFKSLEFGSMVVSVPCLLACSWCVARGKWSWFFGVWLVAVSTRQSALAWLALPAWIAWREWRWENPAPGARLARATWIRPALGVGFGVVAYLGIHAVVNETYAQRTLTRGMFGQWEFVVAARHFGWAAGVWAVAVGLSAFWQGLSGAPVESGERRASRSFRLLQFGGLLAILVFFATDPRSHVAWEHPLCEGDRGRAYLGFLALLAGIGWWRGGFRLRGEWIAVALAAAALVCLRRMVWDYYFMDVALAAMLATERAVSPARSGVDSSGATDSSRPWRFGVRRLMPFHGFALLAALVVTWWHAGFVRELKNYFSGQAAVVALSENALRAGRIAPAQLTLGPFGYQGWHWFPHFVKQDGPRGEFIADFLGYLKGNSLEIISSAPGAPPWRFNDVTVAPATPAGAAPAVGSELASGVFRWEWRVPVRFALRIPAGAETPARKTVDVSSMPYEPQRFPLNDAEWREFIEARCVAAKSGR